MLDERLNCWEFKKCGREPGGTKASTKGICPAAAGNAFNTFNNGINAGRSCWLVAGTFCDHEIMGTFAEKINTCKSCRFYKKVQEEEHFFDTIEGNISIYAATHICYVKKANEDRYYFKRLQDDTLLFAVADGLGGQAAGDYAAEILRGKLANLTLVPRGKEEEVLSALAIETDSFIIAAGEKDEHLEGMGTTYSRNILDQALGSILDEPETGSIMLEPDDIFILSTDGLIPQSGTARADCFGVA